MPAADFTPNQRALLGLWGAFSSAAAQHLTTAELFAVLRDAREQVGAGGASLNIMDVNRIRSLASANARASTYLQRAGAAEGIIGRMIGQTPYARDLADQARSPEFLVRYPHTFKVNGELDTHYMTSIVQGNLEGFTKGSLLDLANADAETHALDYDVEHVGIGDIEILAR